MQDKNSPKTHEKAVGKGGQGGAQARSRGHRRRPWECTQAAARVEISSTPAHRVIRRVV